MYFCSQNFQQKSQYKVYKAQVLKLHWYWVEHPGRRVWDGFWAELSNSDCLIPNSQGNWLGYITLGLQALAVTLWPAAIEATSLSEEHFCSTSLGTWSHLSLSTVNFKGYSTIVFHLDLVWLKLGINWSHDLISTLTISLIECSRTFRKLK